MIANNEILGFQFVRQECLENQLLNIQGGKKHLSQTWVGGCMAQNIFGKVLMSVGPQIKKG